MRRIFVTSFSPEGYEQYGRRFIEGFLQYFPEDTYLYVFYEAICPDIKNRRLVYFNLLTDLELMDFLNRHKDIPAHNGITATGIDYRWQATKFARKIFALTSPQLPYSTFRCWIDADVIVKRPIPVDFFKRHFSDRQYLAYYIGRPTAWHHSECGFMHFYLGPPGKLFLEHFRSMYVTDKLFDLSETHDSFVFDHLRGQYEQDTPFCNIAKEHDIFHPWPKTILGEYMQHLKGPEAKSNGQGVLVPPVLATDKKDAAPIELMSELMHCKNRYAQLIKIVSIYKPTSMVEVGTWNGDRALELASEALKHKPTFNYIGFDLFEQLDEITSRKEHNVKSICSIEIVKEKLQDFARQNSGFSFELIQGNTRTTLPQYVFSKKIDFAFIDGGHSVETIRSDLKALLPHMGLIVLDDYYTKGVDTNVYGCNSVVANQPHAVLPVQDNFSDGKSIQMVMMGEAMRRGDGSAPLQLKTKNSATDEEIQKNIAYAAQFQRESLEAQALLIKSYRRPVLFLKAAYAPHEDTVVLVGASEDIMKSGDEEYRKTWDELREFSKDPKYKIVVCKTSYRKMMQEEGIIPWGCILLDPRDHVAKHIDAHPDVLYFVASMCHSSTWDLLLKAHCKVLGYHAVVGAGETETVKKNFNKTLCVAGGTTSITRGISLFHHLGFRKQIIYGATSSYKIKPERPHGRTEKPIINVEVGGEKFITDPELTAQSQDSEMVVKLYGSSATFDFRGYGMVNVALQIIKDFDRDNPGHIDFTDIRVGQWVNAFKAKNLEMEVITLEMAIKALEARRMALKSVVLPLYTEIENPMNFTDIAL